MDQTTQNKIGQLFMIGLQGTTLSEDEKSFIVKNNIGGITLFGRNIESAQQTFELCKSLKDLRHEMPEKTPLLIGIDMEGGRVARLQEPFTIWPAQATWAEIDSSTVSFNFGQALGAELHATGINFNYSPCVDVLTNPNNKVIGDRSFGNDPELVGKLSSGVVRGLIKSNILACAKHFPGHGNTVVDSHEDLPIDNVSLEEMQKTMIPPFKKTFRSRLDFVMTAHIKYPSIDPDHPATLSKKIINDILRDEIRYRSLVITDDLDMKALRNNYSIEEIPVRALQAGCDLLLYCNEPDSHRIGLESVKKATDNKEIDRIALTKSYDLLIKTKKKINLDEITWEQAQKTIGCQDHLDLAQALSEKRVP